MYPRSKRTRWWLGAGAAVILVAIAYFSLADNGDDGVEVQAELVYIDDIQETVVASGRIQPRTAVDITAEVSAQVLDIFVQEGDQVERNQPLLLLDTVQLRADESQARFSLEEITARAEAARTDFERSEREYRRQSSLFDQKLTSQTELDNATFTYESAKASYDAVLAQVKTARAVLDKARDNLAKTSIRSPMAGVVTYLNVEEGEIAQAQTSFTQGKTLMTVSDLSLFEVEADVDETEVAHVRIGQPVEVRIDAFRDTSFSGTVEEISNSARISGEGTEDYSTSFKVKVLLTHAGEAIRPGMSASVDITTATAEGARVVPYAAVVAREFDPDTLAALRAGIDLSKSNSGEVQAAEVVGADGAGPETVQMANDDLRRREKITVNGLFVIEDGIARFKEVKTGIADEVNLVILNGINVGDTVVSGTFQTLRKLKDGDVVRINDESIKKMDEES